MGLLDALGLKLPKNVVTLESLETTPVSDADAPEAGTAPPMTDTGAAAGSGGSGGAASPPDKNAVAFASARDAVDKLLDALKTHPQQSHITSEIAAVQAKLSTADALAAAKDYPAATKALGEAKGLCAKAKKKADDWANYARERANSVALAMAFGSADFDWKKWAGPVLNAADAKANASDFAGAINHLKTQFNKVGEQIVKNWITTPKAKAALIAKTSKAAQAYMKAEIDEGLRHLTAAENAQAAKEWSRCVQNASAALRLLGPAARACARREGYETQRTATVSAIAKVRAEPLLKAQADALDEQVKEADVLASHDHQQIEKGLAGLKEAAAKAATWTAAAKTVATHAKERQAADVELAALDSDPAAPKLQAQRDAIRQILANAKLLAEAAPSAAEPVSAWAAALNEVARARTDLAAAKKLATGLAATTAAEAAAAKPTDLKGLKAALDKLRADGKVVAKDRHAKSADAEMKLLEAAIASGDKAIAKKDGAAAAKALRDGAAALAKARSILSDHANFAAQVGAVEAGLKALKASPRAAAIKPRIDAVETALAEGRAKNDANAGAEALAALRRATDAIAAAKAADGERAAFDKRAGEIARLVAKVPAPAKGALEGKMGTAKTKADALAFRDAEKALDAVEVDLEKRQLDAIMKATKPDTKAMTKSAAKIVAKGGAAEVDAMIQALPNGSDVKMLDALAEGRYGVKFKSGPALPADPSKGRTAGDPVRSMKEVCKMFSKIPEHIVKHPSVKGVEFKDQYNDQGAGGSFSYDDAKVRMVGRPGIPQQFGSAQKSKDPVTKTFVDQLPATVEPDCQPKDTTEVEYLGFAAAHEVGHAIDDATGFMQRNGHLAEYGEWTTYGGDLTPIADAVGGDARFQAFYQTPEQKQYVLDKLMNKPATAPAVTPGSPEALAKQAFDNWHRIATSADVYRRQSDCDAIKIGNYIYHEAYARQWVRYRADARKRALTGYQFRAPGEWFAELYAGFRSGKLKDTHPAMTWLKKL